MQIFTGQATVGLSGACVLDYGLGRPDVSHGLIVFHNSAIHWAMRGRPLGAKNTCLTDEEYMNAGRSARAARLLCTLICFFLISRDEHRLLRCVCVLRVMRGRTVQQTVTIYKSFRACKAILYA